MRALEPLLLNPHLPTSPHISPPPQALELMLLNTIGVDPEDGVGKTPLRVAVDRNRAEAVSALLTRGANISHADVSGMTPMGSRLGAPPPPEGHPSALTRLSRALQARRSSTATRSWRRPCSSTSA